MKEDSTPEPIERILAANIEIQGLRIDAKTHNLEVGFAEAVPEPSVLDKIDASLGRELPDPEMVMHSPKVKHSPAIDGADAHFIITISAPA